MGKVLCKVGDIFPQNGHAFRSKSTILTKFSGIDLFHEANSILPKVPRVFGADDGASLLQVTPLDLLRLFFPENVLVLVIDACNTALKSRYELQNSVE